MRLKNIYIIILIVLGGILFTSCSDFLMEDPKSFIGPNQVGNTDAAINQWVTGVYSKWCDDMFRWDNFPRVLELDCDYTSGPDWAFSNLGAGNFQGDDVSAVIWTGGYGLINRTNVAIKYVNEITGASPGVKENALGELYFQKAFMYFLLTRAYGEIPLFDKAISDGADYNQPRKPITEVYAEIIRLLVDAKELLYKNTDANFSEGHVSAGTAVALLAKVYATMAAGALPAGEEMIIKTGAAYTMNGDNKVLTRPVSKTFQKIQVSGYENFNVEDCYTKAAQYADSVINGSYGHYDLLPYNELWKRGSYNKTEHMFMVQAVSGDEKYGNHIRSWFSGVLDNAGVITTGQWIGNRFHWYSLFDSEDLRIVDGVKHRWRYSYQVEGNNGFYYPNTPEYTLMATGRNEDGTKVAEPVPPFNDGVTYIYNVTSECLAFTTKYMDVTDPTLDRSDAYWPFLRFADVLLIYAEAKTELSQDVSSEAIAALNRVRERSNARPATTAGDGAITTKVALRSAIFEERAKEFALEGDRRWDLIRWGLYLDVMNSIGGYDEAGIFKNRENRHLLYPLPQAEVLTNKAISENNPGWN